MCISIIAYRWIWIKNRLIPRLTCLGQHAMHLHYPWSGKGKLLSTTQQALKSDLGLWDVENIHLDRIIQVFVYWALNEVYEWLHAVLIHRERDDKYAITDSWGLHYLSGVITIEYQYVHAWHFVFLDTIKCTCKHSQPILHSRHDVHKYEKLDIAECMYAICKNYILKALYL